MWLRVPVQMISLFFVTVISSFVNFASHPTSQNIPIETRLAVLRSGTMWASVASGSSGRSRFPSWVDLMVASFGMLIVIGFFDGIGATLKASRSSGLKKCPDDPVSAIGFDFFAGEQKVEELVSCVLLLFFVTFLTSILTFLFIFPVGPPPENPSCLCTQNVCAVCHLVFFGFVHILPSCL